jgi:hypothetical protein
MKSKMHVWVVMVLMVVMLSGIANAEIPPTPITLVADVSGGNVNYTWTAGVGNVTDTYNVSISVSGATRTWTNTSGASSNNSVGLDNWAEIWIYAYNITGNGSLSIGYAYADTQADRSTFGETVDLMNAVPDILNPVVDIIIVVISIMIILAIGALVTGTLGAIVEGIKKKIKL